MLISIFDVLYISQWNWLFNVGLLPITSPCFQRSLVVRPADFSPGFIGAFHLCGRGKHGWKVGPAGNSGIAGALNHQWWRTTHESFLWVSEFTPVIDMGFL